MEAVRRCRFGFQFAFSKIGSGKQIFAFMVIMARKATELGTELRKDFMRPKYIEKKRENRTQGGPAEVVPV